MDNYTVEVTLNGFSVSAVYSILGIQITPLHFYGSVAKYDYANNKFGFDYGDLSKQENMSSTPLGAGPYRFIRYENGVVYFEANDYYYKGAPKIREIQFKEFNYAEVPAAIRVGVIDLDVSGGSRAFFEEIASHNSNGELTGEVITTFTVDNSGYGYIGINARNVNVAGEPGTEASKNLRKGLATILAVYRNGAIDSFYGDAAYVINYPISSTSWAAPQPTDADYEVAFSVDTNGEPIYSAVMAPEEKYLAAEQAALGFFEAAGFCVVDGVVTAAPEGAKLAYEVIVPGGGIGDHPAFAILTAAKVSLAEIGITLNIIDLVNPFELWDALGAGSQELWAAALGQNLDPDMYPVYHSSNVVGAGGTGQNHYYLTDQTMDALLVEARTSQNQDLRKTLYKAALDIVMDWAVEIPTYQRLNCTVMSTERIAINTVTPNLTTYWKWVKDIELMEIHK